MKTQNHLKPLLLLLMAFAITTPSISAVTAGPSVTPTEQRADQLKQRLEEIRALDMKKLSRKEKKALRGEVRAIKSELAEISGGVYLSVGRHYPYCLIDHTTGLTGLTIIYHWCITLAICIQWRFVTGITFQEFVFAYE